MVSLYQHRASEGALTKSERQAFLAFRSRKRLLLTLIFLEYVVCFLSSAVILGLTYTPRNL